MPGRKALVALNFSLPPETLLAQALRHGGGSRPTAALHRQHETHLEARIRDPLKRPFRVARDSKSAILVPKISNDPPAGTPAALGRTRSSLRVVSTGRSTRTNGSWVARQRSLTARSRGSRPAESASPVDVENEASPDRLWDRSMGFVFGQAVVDDTRRGAASVGSARVLRGPAWTGALDRAAQECGAPQAIFPSRGKGFWAVLAWDLAVVCGFRVESAAGCGAVPLVLSSTERIGNGCGRQVDFRD